MDLDSILRALSIDPANLEPAPAWKFIPTREAMHRIGPPTPLPCSSCGAPARATLIIDVPGHGTRWLDRCRDCFLATVK